MIKAAASGTDIPSRRLPLADETTPTSQGATAPPQPETAKTKPIARADTPPSLRWSMAIAVGKIGPRPKPATAEPRSSSGAGRPRRSKAMPAMASDNP